jgi:hypothetical protein
LAERRYKRPPATDVFAVEDTSAQVVWRDLDPGPVEVSARVRHESTAAGARLERTDPAGGLIVDGLQPATSYDLELRLRGEVVHQQELTTLATPPGPQLFRLAALNDLHLGCAWFGPFGTMREELAPGQPPSSIRCATAGVADALGWGAERLVLRGDLVHRGEMSEWAAAADLLAGIDVAVDVVLGNHETSIRARRVDLATGLERLGIELNEPIRSVQLPGLDLLLTDTAVAHTDPGVIDHLADDLIEVAAKAAHPVLLMTHHNLERRWDVFTLPRGVPPRSSLPFLDQLAEASPATLVSSGHTHRHRRRLHRTIPVVEVGSPKDYPGVWCGYAVHEGGIRQVVRRITDPECITWTDRTRTSMGGIWGWWSSGRLSDRCFSHSWPTS